MTPTVEVCTQENMLQVESVQQLQISQLLTRTHNTLLT